MRASYSGGLRVASLACALGLLSACSSTPSQPTPPGGWGFSGKIGLWAYGEQESANVDWQDCDSRYLVRLSGPLGVGGALIYGDDQGVSLQRGGEDTLHAESPEALLASMGWYLPVSLLRFWLQGQPSPDAPYQRESADNAITRLSQSGWDIAYQFQNDQISRISMEDGTIRLKWIIRNWHERVSCTAP